VLNLARGLTQQQNPEPTAWICCATSLQQVGTVEFGFK